MPLPLPRASQDVLGGCPVVDALLLTSVWAVAVLRQLAQVSTGQLGVASAVGISSQAIKQQCAAARWLPSIHHVVLLPGCCDDATGNAAGIILLARMLYLQAMRK